MKSEALVYDTNVLVYAVTEESELHNRCLQLLESSRRGSPPGFITWSVCYEFLRFTTHPRHLPEPLRPQDAWDFVKRLLESPGFRVLRPTDRHGEFLTQTLAELPNLRGNVMHDLHTAVLMRENNIARICTHDGDFRRFPFLETIDPMDM